MSEKINPREAKLCFLKCETLAKKKAEIETFLERIEEIKQKDLPSWKFKKLVINDPTIIRINNKEISAFKYRVFITIKNLENEIERLEDLIRQYQIDIDYCLNKMNEHETQVNKIKDKN